MIKKIKIFDLDGTLIDSLHRYKTINNKIDLNHWRENSTPEKILKDKLLPLTTYYRKCLNDATIYTIIATARTITSADYIFIKEILGEGKLPDKFIHRKNDKDVRGGADLKAKPIKSLLNLKQFKGKKIYFYDDNKKYLDSFKKIIPETILYYIPSQQGH